MNKAYLIAPSKHISPKHLNNAKRHMKEMGYETEHRKDILDIDDYHAGTVIRRAEEMNEAFRSEADTIWCVRGGYASMELLPLLRWKDALRTKKTFIGHSDITSLLLGLYMKGYRGTLIHGPNAGGSAWPDKKKDKETLRKCIAGEDYKVKLPASVKYSNKKEFLGKIIGGNLEILTHLIGTPFEPVFNNKILFLEEVNLKPSQIYNMLIQLRMAGKLKGIKALLLGRMNGCGRYLPMIKRFISTMSIPVIYDIPLGHEKGMIPIRIGEKVRFAKNSLEFFA